MSDNEPLSPPTDGLTRPELRRRLNQELSTNSELEAFLLDYFEQTYRELTRGMDRTTKVNELLHRNNVEDVISCLDKYIAEKNSNSSLFKRIKKASWRKFKKIYIILSIIFGVTVEHTLGPVGKLVKILSLTTVASATAVTGSYIIITQTNAVPNRTIVALNKKLGTKLSTPAMRQSLDEQEDEASASNLSNRKEGLSDIADMGSDADAEISHETDVASNSNETDIAATHETDTLSNNTEVKRQNNAAQMKFENLRRILDFSLNRIAIMEAENRERDRQDKERDRHIRDLQMELERKESRMRSLESDIQRLKYK